MNHPPPALLLRDLTKRYGNGAVALSRISLEIEPGSFVAVLGPNGAGKSTLINILAQVVTKTEGEVEIFGVSIDQHPRRAKRLIGFTPQEIALDPFFNVRQLLHNHAGYYGIRDGGDWIETLLEKLDLAPHAAKLSRQLSGGMKRRLTIAKALVHQPRLLILDEPTAGVDVTLRHSLWRFIRELHRSGMTVILTTHYLEEAQELADRVAIIDKGRIIAWNRTGALLEEFGARRFEIQLGDGEPVTDLLDGLAATLEGNRLHGVFTPDTAGRLFSWLDRHAGRVRDIRIEPPNLEEVFLKLTGEPSRATGAGR